MTITISSAPEPQDDGSLPPFAEDLLSVLRNPGSDPAFYLAISILAPMPKAERNVFLARINTFYALDLEDVAIFLKHHEPELTDGEVAARIGVSASTISRMKRYQKQKPGPDDFVNKRPRQSKRRVNRRGDRWERDHPGG